MIQDLTTHSETFKLGQWGGILWKANYSCQRHLHTPQKPWKTEVLFESSFHSHVHENCCLGISVPTTKSERRSNFPTHCNSSTMAKVEYMTTGFVHILEPPHPSSQKKYGHNVFIYGIVCFSKLYLVIRKKKRKKIGPKKTYKKMTNCEVIFSFISPSVYFLSDLPDSSPPSHHVHTLQPFLLSFLILAHGLPVFFLPKCMLFMRFFFLL